MQWLPVIYTRAFWLDERMAFDYGSNIILLCFWVGWVGPDPFFFFLVTELLSEVAAMQLMYPERKVGLVKVGVIEVKRVMMIDKW